MADPYIRQKAGMPKCSSMKGKSALAERTSAKIREWCTKSGFTKATPAAHYCGIAQPTFHNYYVGKRLPTLEHWETICRKLGGNLNEVFCDLVPASEKTRKWMTILKARYEADAKERNNIELFVRGLWKQEEIIEEILHWIKAKI